MTLIFLNLLKNLFKLTWSQYYNQWNIDMEEERLS